MICNEEIDPQALDVETEIIKFRQPISVTAQVSKITNAVSVSLVFNTAMQVTCGRCLGEFEIELKKKSIFGLLQGWKIDTQSLKDELREIDG